jgi:phosphatidylethanolamine/phosphatidyl-N-methylethanolamine N-methyltransferase
MQLQEMNSQDVRNAYKRWAPIYDATFGKIVAAGVKQTVARANQYSGALLEAGVGTGLALPHYASQLQVTGIDLSSDMLIKARKRIEKSRKHNVEALLEMDACHMSFPDARFDISVAMYVLTVVPDPAAVMHELARVTKPGGRVLIANHFSVEGGVRGALEKGLAKQATKLGWRPEFPLDTVLVSDKLRLVSIKGLKPMGFFTLLEFVRI